ncbi:SH3 domain-binding glutamic acid-rich-like protein 3 [Globicephala melas]|uniref:SH3 domain-binding glutamic acid-rich-like protein 3 n=1 Tax=Globicephala melas TaxID=9731 RepID=UPI00293D30E6|nr:SH3 domain-binding glutamic acid-rich-like protein 3 [Globicephala melas]
MTRGLSRKETAPDRGGLVSRPCSCCHHYPVCLSARRPIRSMSGLRVYSTSVTGSREIKSQQSEVTRILDGKRIQYQLVDISQDNALRDEMRALAGNPKATPPQIVNGDQYCGDYELFVEAVEQNTLQEFLKLA